MVKIDVCWCFNNSNTTKLFFDAAFPNLANGEDEFFMGDAPKPAVVSDQRKADQKKVDSALLKAVGSVDMLEAYLAAQFTLTTHDKPHLMKF